MAPNPNKHAENNFTIEVTVLCGAKIIDLLKPCDSNLLKAFQVSLLVNSPANNSEGCILPA